MDKKAVLIKARAKRMAKLEKHYVELVHQMDSLIDKIKQLVKDTE